MIRQDALLSLLILISASVLILGCGSGSPQAGVSMSDMAAQVESSRQQDAEDAKNRPASPAEPPKPPEEPTVVTAKTPKKGKSLHDQGSYLSAVGSARFRAEHQMILNQVTHALNLYRAEKGYYPKSHDVFMTEIIEKNLIRLPALEDGYEYWYDTEDNLLKQRPIPTDE